MNAQEVADNVRELCFLPQTSEFDDAKILKETNMAQRMALTPALLRANGEYLTEIVDVLPDQSTGVATFPPAAVASTARVITWVYSDGTESEPLQFCSIGDQPSSSRGNYAVGAPTEFVQTPDGIRVLGGVPAAVYLRIRFPRRPGSLVLPAQVPVLGPAGLWPGPLALKIRTIAVVGLVYEMQLEGLYGAQAGLVVLGNGVTSWCELSTPTSPYRVKAFHIFLAGQPAVWQATISTFGGYVPQVGDIFNLENTAWNPQFPEEWQDLLCYYGAARMAGLRKDRALKAELLGDSQSILHELINEAQPRTKLAPKVINAMRGHIRRPWRYG